MKIALLHVDEQSSILVQHVLHCLGYWWESGSTEIKQAYHSYIHIFDNQTYVSGDFPDKQVEQYDLRGYNLTQIESCLKALVNRVHIDGRPVTLDSDGKYIVVGCIKISFETMEKIYNEMVNRQNDRRNC